MFIISKRGKWGCIYCNKFYDTQDKALECVDTHKLILVPIAKEDLNRLLTFIYIKDSKLLSSDLIRIIQRYNNESAIRQITKEDEE